MRLQSVVSVGTAAILLLSGCGGNVETATPRVDVQPTSPFGSLLARIPDNETTRESVLITDIAAVREHAGIETPEPDADEQAVFEYIKQVSLAGQNGPKTIIPRDEAWIAGFHNYIQRFTTYPYLGIDARNVDQIAVYQGSPTATVEIVAGRYARDSAQARLAECDECPSPSIVEHQGESFWAWGEDATGRLRDQLKPPAFDFVGRGGRIWIDEGFAVRTLRTADMQEVIDASLDKIASLADDDDYTVAARALTDVGATSAIFSAASFKSGELFERMKPLATAGAFQMSDDLLRVRLEEGPLLKPFELIAVGTAFDGSDPYSALVLVHESSALASTNAALIRQRIETSIQPLNAPLASRSDQPPQAKPQYWRDVIERYTVDVKGRALVARLYGVNAALLVSSDVMGFDGFPVAPLTVSE